MEDLTDDVTHIISCKNTSKVNDGRKKGLNVVHFEWLLEVFRNWEKPDESLFPIIENNEISSESLSQIERLAAELFFAYVTDIEEIAFGSFSFIFIIYYLLSFIIIIVIIFIYF